MYDLKTISTPNKKKYRLKNVGQTLVSIWLAEIFHLQKLGQMLQGRILSGLISPRLLPTHTDDLTQQTTNYCFIRVYQYYRDPNPKKLNFANPVQDIAATSWVGALIWKVGKFGLCCSLTDSTGPYRTMQDHTQLYRPMQGTIQVPKG